MSKTSRINRQQQIQVLIRLKPQLCQQRYQKCAYVSQQQQNALVVETPTKKQYFVFDSVANQHITQLQLYHTMGRQAVTQTLQGFNCCIFAYGQTGSGKTYSILGAIQDIMSDIYTESRGILPRLLQDLMREVKQNTDKASILCSYMQIYNQQIFDLLNQNMRSLSIREGKKGVYVQNLLQQNVSSYQDAISLVIKGQKNRKIASTSMNSQSSRSHTIFTIYLQSEINSQQKSMTRRSKMHIVDLAGSERVKHTNVQGQRLKQGCNINKSLHVLGSVINALVQSTKTKKQKHVPFRDSKLTHFLKDSLAGNSITKLLATIQSNKLYYGDTLSTLMFAKRAKIIRVKVQANQNATENYDSLRKQVKRLREQLAQTKYLAEGRFSQRFKTQNDTDNYNNQIDTQNLQYSTTDKPIHIFEQNQLHYKALIEIYEEHLNECMNYNDQNDANKNNVFKKKNNNIINHSQWKKLQKKNKILTDLLRKMPAFTRIFRENQLLKQQRSKYEQNIKISEQYSNSKLRNQLSLESTATNNIQQTKQMHSTTIQLSDISLSDNSILQQSMITSPYQQQLILRAKQKTAQLYQQLIDQIKQQFTNYIDQLDRSYNQLQRQIEQKDKKLKQIFKRNIQQRPDIKQLNDENQYLKLNILELQDQIAQLQKQLQHTRIQKKQLKRRNTIQQQNQYQQDKDIILTHKNSQKYQDNSIHSINSNNMSASSHKFMQSIHNIEEQQNNNNNDNIHQNNINNQNQHQQINSQNNRNLNTDEQIIKYLYKLRQDAIKQMQIYQKQRLKMIQCIQILQKQCRKLDIENKSQLLTIQQLKISKNNIINKFNKMSAQNNQQLQQINVQNILQLQQTLSIDALWKQINSQKMTFEQLQAYKQQIKKQYETMNIKLNQMDQIKKQLNLFLMKQKAVEKQFGKSIDKILDEYAEIIEKNKIQINQNENNK